MIIIILIISFLLDGIIFSLTSINNVIAPLFSLLSLVLTYPYYCHNKKKMYLCTCLIGVLYDIVYTNSLFLNTLAFMGIIYLISKVYKIFINNFLNTFLISTITICFYRIFIYIFFLILDVVNWNIIDFINSITASLIINYIYIIVFYFILHISKIKNKKKHLINFCKNNKTIIRTNVHKRY